MRSITWICLLFVLLVLPASLWARGPAGVSNTIHNLSSGGVAGTFPTVYTTNADEVCVFCHTPHGGSLRGPLWNRSLPSGTFTHYNSATLTLTSLPGMTASRTVNDESLLCMSCHDGSIALDHLLNDPNSLGGADISYTFWPGAERFIADGLGQPNANIGGSTADWSASGDLSDDHPISFSYADVVAQAIYGVGGAKEDELRPIGNTALATSVLGWQGEGVRLFGADYRVECSSCHDPHVDYDTDLSATADPAYDPFLIRPNSGSNLCLACHNK